MSNTITLYNVNLHQCNYLYYFRDVRKRQSDPERVYYNTEAADRHTGLSTTRQDAHQPPSHSNDPNSPVTYDEIGDVTIQSVNKAVMDEGQKDEYENVSGPRKNSESYQYLSVIVDSYESLEAGNVSYQNVVTDNNTDPKCYTSLKY